MALQVTIVASDRRVFNGDVEMCVAPSSDGEIGILKGHQPVMTILKDGIVRLTGIKNAEDIDGTDSANKQDKLNVHITGGFLGLYDDEVCIIADNAKID